MNNLIVTLSESIIPQYINYNFCVNLHIIVGDSGVTVFIS